jgi:hypothetical protein
MIKRIIKVNLISVISILLFCFLFFGIAESVSSKRIAKEYVSSLLATKAQSLEDYLRSVDYTAFTIMFSNWVQQLLLSGDNTATVELEMRRQSASHALSSFSSVSDNLSFVLLSPSGVLSGTSGTEGPSMLWSNNTLRYNTRYNIEEENWIHTLRTQRKHTECGASRLFYSVEPKWSITNYYLVTSIYNFAPIGYFAVNITEDNLRFLTTVDTADTAITISAGDTVLLDTTPLLSSNTFKYLTIAETRQFLNDVLTVTISTQYPRNPFSSFGRYNLFFLLLIPLLLFYITMISNLLQKNAQIDKQRREAEFDMLQDKVHPHFLYNTLEIINAFILDGQYDEAIHSTEMLGKIFHYNLSSTKWVTAAEEINYSKQYLALIAYKTKDISINFDVTPDVTNTRMLKLVLQPLIENAIIHGLRTGSPDKQLVIGIHKKQQSSKRAAQKIEITIRDTGCGFAPDVLYELYKDFALIQSGKDFIEKPSIGIRNVYKRLFLEYGKAGLEFAITNNIQSGSTITISYPA